MMKLQKTIGKKAIDAFLVLVLALIIIAVVAFFIFLFSSTSISEKTTELKTAAELQLQKQITICNDDHTTKYDIAGWGDLGQIYGVDPSLRLGGKKGLVSMHVKLEQTNENHGIILSLLSETGEDWDVTKYPYLRFAYKIKPQTPLCLISEEDDGTKWVLASTTNPDCGYVGLVEPRQLKSGVIFVRPFLADGAWHEMEIHYDDDIMIRRLHLWAFESGSKGDEYWIDEFVIAEDPAYETQFYCTGFEDFGGINVRS